MGAAESAPTPPPDNEILERRNRNIKRMDQAVRKKLRGGVQFNMKVIIRGSQSTGKTSLWRRLQGLSLDKTSQSTKEIQTANINWAFKNMEEAVKVEVWDVADGNKILEDDQSPKTTMKKGLLTSSVVNVYQNTQAVIFMINPHQPESLDYVINKLNEKELSSNISVLILVNFKDLPPPPPSPPPPSSEEEKEEDETEKDVKETKTIIENKVDSEKENNDDNKQADISTEKKGEKVEQEEQENDSEKKDNPNPNQTAEEEIEKKEEGDIVKNSDEIKDDKNVEKTDDNNNHKEEEEKIETPPKIQYLTMEMIQNRLAGINVFISNSNNNKEEKEADRNETNEESSSPIVKNNNSLF
eukprot:CAMPEP_0114343656 /NCGR_PEP_ID=MMETSP0101-20121206/10788_1 /TAXON_ID=38822 ORGANISM="Pteridomonas danica, Strain PT" /NCGR_SAMPLE_ID=MMETSP0101 /ASSEMBLY_ACC=CAM_ASM_000211 /LENGTH=355 /DNA_ID=CAMNT_0001478523 /DNA_START=80 /DNA_END=1147 /DNA_ORIENTATION=+